MFMWKAFFDLLRGSVARFCQFCMLFDNFGHFSLISSLFSSVAGLGFVPKFIGCGIPESNWGKDTSSIFTVFTDCHCKLLVAAGPPLNSMMMMRSKVLGGAGPTLLTPLVTELQRVWPKRGPSAVRQECGCILNQIKIIPIIHPPPAAGSGRHSWVRREDHKGSAISRDSRISRENEIRLWLKVKSVKLLEIICYYLRTFSL